jgi:hypothetical protein
MAKGKRDKGAAPTTKTSTDITGLSMRIAPIDPNKAGRLAHADRASINDTINRLEMNFGGEYRPIALAAFLRLCELGTGHLNGEPITTGDELNPGNAAAANVALQANREILNRLLGRPTVKIESTSNNTLDVRVLTAKLATESLRSSVKYASADPPPSPPAKRT